MPSVASSTPVSPQMAYDPEQALMALSEQTFRMVAVARALVASSRHIDVEGLQQHFGLLCAKALDLSPGRTGLVRAELLRLLRGLDALQIAMREQAA